MELLVRSQCRFYNVFPRLNPYFIENGNICLDGNGTWALRAYLANISITLPCMKSDTDWPDLQFK